MKELIYNIKNKKMIDKHNRKISILVKGFTLSFNVHIDLILCTLLPFRYY